jgi:hypothetical protein
VNTLWLRIAPPIADDYGVADDGEVLARIVATCSWLPSNPGLETPICLRQKRQIQ